MEFELFFYLVRDMLAFSALTYQEGHLICKTRLQLPVETSVDLA